MTSRPSSQSASLSTQAAATRPSGSTRFRKACASSRWGPTSRPISRRRRKSWDSSAASPIRRRSRSNPTTARPISPFDLLGYFPRLRKLSIPGTDIVNLVSSRLGQLEEARLSVARNGGISRDGVLAVLHATTAAPSRLPSLRQLELETHFSKRQTHRLSWHYDVAPQLRAAGLTFPVARGVGGRGIGRPTRYGCVHPPALASLAAWRSPPLTPAWSKGYPFAAQAPTPTTTTTTTPPSLTPTHLPTARTRDAVDVALASSRPSISLKLLLSVVVKVSCRRSAACRSHARAPSSCAALLAAGWPNPPRSSSGATSPGPRSLHPPSLLLARTRRRRSP